MTDRTSSPFGSSVGLGRQRLELQAYHSRGNSVNSVALPQKCKGKPEIDAPPPPGLGALIDLFIYYESHPCKVMS